MTSPLTSVSTPTPTPDPHPRPEVGAPAEPTIKAEIPTPVLGDTLGTAIQRARKPGYRAWLAHVAGAGECTHPVRLAGDLHIIDTRTGEITATTTTATLPDAVIYKPCGNRRKIVCPACSEVYRADTYQLIHAGIAGGKGLPETVRGHPFAFVTLTAPSFGLVHTTRALNGRPRPCRPRRKPQTCPHGVQLACAATHHDGDPALGRPLCLDCYDHDHQAVWNMAAGELWRRTLTTLGKQLRGYQARVSFGKVAEMQARGVVHFHAILRLDHTDPNLRVTPDGDLLEVPAPPPSFATFEVLAALLGHAARSTQFDTPAHADRVEGWPIRWGQQLDIRPVHAATRQQLGTGPISETAVAGYLAKYATKATEATGHTSARLTAATIRGHADPATHSGRLLAACRRLGRPGADTHREETSGRLAYSRLRRWAHMLGFGGHFSTKSRRYSTTLTALRQARIAWRREHLHDRRPFGRLRVESDQETTLLLGSLSFAGIGWHTTGDALLANTSPGLAREHRRVGRDEIAHEDRRRLPPAA